MSWNGTSVWSCSGMDNVTIPNWKTLSIGNMTQKHHGDFAASVHFYKSRGGVRELSSHSKSMGVMCLAFRWHAASFSMLWKHVVNHWWWWSIEFKVHWVLWSLGVGHVWTAFVFFQQQTSLTRSHMETMGIAFLLCLHLYSARFFPFLPHCELFICLRR